MIDQKEATAKQLVDLGLQLDDWKRESNRFRDKWLAAERRADIADGRWLEARADNDRIHMRFVYMLRTNWLLWIVNVVVLLLLLKAVW